MQNMIGELSTHAKQLNLTDFLIGFFNKGA